MKHSRIIFMALFALLLILTASGCSSKSGAKTDGGLDGSGLSESDLNAAREGRFGDGSIPTGDDEGPFRNVHFEYDSSTLSDEARQNLEYNVQILEQNPQVKVQLEGHCDERGTAEYNLALGQRRSHTVYEALISYGVSPARLSTISYGSEVPLVQGTGEQAWAKNRRVHFSGYAEKQNS